ncbi:MAG: AsmA-like C-terminal domain-containing protein [Magnetococcus sp. YQC-5]
MPNTDFSLLHPLHPKAIGQLISQRSGCVRHTIRWFMQLFLFVFFLLTAGMTNLALFPPDITPYLDVMTRFFASQTGLMVHLRSISLQTGLSLTVVGQGVAISSAHSNAPLLDVEQIQFRISPLSWWQGHVSGTLSLEQASITLRREASGRLLLGDMDLDNGFARKRNTSDVLPINSLSLHNATVLWVDEMTLHQGQPLRHRFTQVNATWFLEQNGSARFSAEAALPDSSPQTKLFIKGKRDQAGVWSSQIQVAQLTLTPWIPYLIHTPPLDGLTSPLSLEVNLTWHSWSSMQAQWRVQVGSGILAWPALFRWPVPVTRITADGQLNHSNRIWNLDVHRFDLVSTHGQAKGHFTLSCIGCQESPYLDLTASASGTPTDKAKFYYPTPIMPPSLVRWLDNSLKEGYVKQATARIRGRLPAIPAGPRDPKEDLFHIEGDVTGVTLQYYPPLRPLTNINTHVVFDRYSFKALVDKATFKGDSNLKGTVKIENMLDNPVVEITSASPAVDLHTIWEQVVSHPHLQWNVAVGMEDTLVRGRGAATMNIILPLENLSAWSYSARLELKDTTFHPHFLPSPLTDASGLLTLDRDRMDLKVISARYGEFPLTGQMTTQNYRTPSQALLLARMETRLDERFLSDCYEPVLGDQGWVKGHAPLWMEFFRKPGDSGFQIKGRVDLQSVAAQGQMGFLQQINENGMVKAEGMLSKTGQLRLNALHAQIGNVHADGQLDWDLSRNQGRVTLKDARLGATQGTMRLAYQGAATRNPGAWMVHADLSRLDLRSLWSDDKAKSGEKQLPTGPMVLKPSKQRWPRVTLALHADQLLLSHDETAKRLNAKMEMELRSLRIDSWRMIQGAGEVQGTGEFLWSNQMGTGGYSGRLHVTSKDFGKLFRSVDIITGLEAGSGDLDITLDGFLPRDTPWIDTLSGVARFNFKHGKIRQFGFLSSLLGIFSLPELPNLMVGARPDLDGTGLHYKEFKGGFFIHDNLWDIDSMKLTSPSMNIIFNGQVNFPKNRVDMLVGIRPLQTLDAIVNGVPILGKLVTGDRQTMVETQFDVTGAIHSPSVSLRPMTSIAPGLLRDWLSVPMNIWKHIQEPSFTPQDP